MRRSARRCRTRIGSGCGARAVRGAGAGLGTAAWMAAPWPLTAGGWPGWMAVLSMGRFLLQLERLHEGFEVGFLPADQLGRAGHLDEPGAVAQRQHHAEDAQVAAVVID